jgi:hypothetical protein
MIGERQAAEAGGEISHRNARPIVHDVNDFRLTFTP